MHLWVVGTGFVVSIFVSYLVSRYRGPLAVLDQPNERSLHTTPTPRLGGIGIVAAVLIAFLIFLQFTKSFPVALMTPILEGYLIIIVVSLMDDIFRMPILARLAAHFMAALVLVYGGMNVYIQLIPDWSSSIPEWAGITLLVFFIVWMINLYNFMDGMDGLAAGMGIIGFGVFAVLGWMRGAQSFTQVSACIAVACGGFLCLNYPPAKIFMGDVGSASLGFLAAALILWASNHNIFPLWAGVMVFSPFIADATWTLICRLLSGKNIWRAHQGHLYQRLIRLGFGQRKVVLSEYAIMLGCGMAAIILDNNGHAVIQIIGLTCMLLVFFGIVLSVHMQELRRKRGEPQAC